MFSSLTYLYSSFVKGKHPVSARSEDEIQAHEDSGSSQIALFCIGVTEVKK